MSQVRRRALRSSVLAASLAVVASLVVAPPALAEDPSASPITSAAPTTGAAPTNQPDPTSVATPTANPVPTDGVPTDDGAPTTAAPTDSAPATTVAPEADPALPEPGETVTGELVQAWPDPTAEEHEADGHDHADHDAHDHGDAEGPLSWIDTGDGEAVRVPTDALPDVAVGSTLSVTVGDPVVDEATTEQGFAPAVEVQAAAVLDAATPDPTTASAGSAPTNTVTAVLVAPAGTSPDGMTIGTVVDTLNGAVHSFWDEQSNGTVRITAVQGASGWVSSSAGCGDPFALWSDVARQVGWSDGPGKHLMLYVPSNASGCAYGLGTVGSSIGSGGLSYVRDAKLSVMGHELGHNFGLGHSSKVQCDGTVESGTCRTVDYADYYDIMGFSWDQVGTLNTAQAARLGLLPSSEQVALTTSSAPTTVTLAPVSASSGTRAVKLTAANGAVYYVEYRQASGRDAWLSDPRLSQNRAFSGVVLRRASSGNNTSLLLDGTPSPSSGWGADNEQVVLAGSRAVVGSGAFVVTVGSLSTAAASIQVAPAAPSAISAKYAATGGEGGVLGRPASNEACGLPRGGCLRHFERGSIYWSPATAAQVITGGLRDRWASLGYEYSWLGYPASGADCSLPGGGCVQVFERGALYWVPGVGAVSISGGLWSGWAQRGYEGGSLGYPVADARCGLSGGGCVQWFAGGSLYWVPGYGARSISGGLLEGWATRGYEFGVLGYPIADAACGLSGGGCVQSFVGGSLYWVPGVGARAMTGGLYQGWAVRGYETGRLGYPVEDARCGRDAACYQSFQGGLLQWNPSRGAFD
ncbi:reprolysin-like metallopeptidase [Klenkia sp. LSe6-5]|uniref:Reprolysin-like metallopeptidase n=1 Tax=Klenkia sesuvii TaxID=3103137 RepID=A0ABU8DUE8_9ACTN